MPNAFIAACTSCGQSADWSTPAVRVNAAVAPGAFVEDIVVVDVSGLDVAAHGQWDVHEADMGRTLRGGGTDAVTATGTPRTAGRVIYDLSGESCNRPIFSDVRQ